MRAAPLAEQGRRASPGTLPEREQRFRSALPIREVPRRWVPFPRPPVSPSPAVWRLRPQCSSPEPSTSLPERNPCAVHRNRRTCAIPQSLRKLGTVPAAETSELQLRCPGKVNPSVPRTEEGHSPVATSSQFGSLLPIRLANIQLSFWRLIVSGSPSTMPPSASVT